MMDNPCKLTIVAGWAMLVGLGLALAPGPMLLIVAGFVPVLAVFGLALGTRMWIDGHLDDHEED